MAVLRDPELLQLPAEIMPLLTQESLSRQFAFKNAAQFFNVIGLCADNACPTVFRHFAQDHRDLFIDGMMAGFHPRQIAVADARPAGPVNVRDNLPAEALKGCNEFFPCFAPLEPD